jgi:hypothetical protein
LVSKGGELARKMLIRLFPFGTVDDLALSRVVIESFRSTKPLDGSASSFITLARELDRGRPVTDALLLPNNPFKERTAPLAIPGEDVCLLCELEGRGGFLLDLEDTDAASCAE